MNQEKIDSRIRDDLFSAHTDTALKALEQIRTKGNKLYLPLLFDLLASTPEDELQAEILRVLGSVKQPDAVDVFAEALASEKYKLIRKQLLVACWQNGLDFKEQLPLLVDFVINEEWETGFEAFTIIDSLKELPSQNIRNNVSDKISDVLDKTEGNKRYFLKEILIIIE